MNENNNVRGAAVRISSVKKSYDGVVYAVNDVSLVVPQGDFVTLLGPSGCGKTTILRSIAGLEQIDQGEIWIGDDLVSGPELSIPPERRAIGMIFQSYAIWPHMTLFENVAFGLRLQKRPAKEIRERVMETLDLVGLSGFETRYGTQLSGGQQQRVALARSVVMRPRVLLFDEPLSNLDATLRERMRFELRRIQRELGITAIYVTHDQSEAMVMSDRIVVMDHGVIVQQGSPHEIYEYPASEFVAGFVGLTNFIEGVVTESIPKDLSTVHLAGNQVIRCNLPEGSRQGDSVKLSIRPESLRLVTEATRENCWELEVIDAVYLGNIVDIVVSFGGQTVRVQSSPELYQMARNEAATSILIGVSASKVRCINVNGLAPSEAERTDSERARANNL